MMPGVPMSATSTRRRAFALTMAVLLLTRSVGAADELKVMTSGAFAAAYLELAPVFERKTGHQIVTEATSIGTGETGIAARLRRGEAIDVVIVASNDLEALIKAGTVRAGTRVDLARSGIGMAVRRGARTPDISSVEALRRTLLEAKSIAYSASVSGNYLSTELFQKLGIADQVLPKSRRIVGERVGAVVARGEAEIGFQQISELVPITGIDFVGPLPAEVQLVSTISAAIGSAAKHPELARTFIEFLGSPAAAEAIENSALEPLVAPQLSARAAPVLRSAEIRVAIHSADACDVAMTIGVESGGTIDHRIEATASTQIHLTSHRGARRVQPPQAIGRTRSLMLEVASREYELAYSVRQPAASHRCPLWVPAAPADGVSRAVRIRVELPAGMSPASTMPAFTWNESTGTATLGHMPAFVRVAYAPTGETPFWNVSTAMDAITVVVFVSASGIWLWRRKR
jgi:molybdate transport system substrate-binding protein